MDDPPAVVGADGGNSKTDLVLALTDGTVLARVRGRGTRSPVDGASSTAHDLAELVRRAWRKAGREPGRTAVAVLDLANLDLPEEEAELASALVRHEIGERVEVGNDTLAVLQAGAPDGWGVGVVCGTGINAIGIGPDGRRVGFLGLGTISGDLGGGGAIAMMAHVHAMRDEDGRGVPTQLRRLLPAHFGLREPSEVALALHRGTLDRLALAEACPVVFRAAGSGDAVARSIVEQFGREAALMACVLLRRLGLDGSGAPVVLGGSILQTRDEILYAAFDAELEARAPGAQYTVLSVPPVAGALDSALRLAGADEAARARARQALVGQGAGTA